MSIIPSKTRLIFFLISQTLINISAEARTLPEILKSGTLRVAVDGATPGFNFYKGHELTGFEVDLASELAKRLGLKIEWKVQPFDSLLVAVNQDRFDLIATSFTISPGRSKAIDFIKPHYCTGAVIVSMPGGPKTVQDLNGKIVVVPVGTVYFDYLKTLTDLKEVRTVPSETTGLQSLLSGRTDAWVTEQFVALEALKVHSGSGLQIGDMLMKQTNAMVVSKGNSLLQATINDEFEKTLKDGTYNRLSYKYFSKDIRCK